MAAHQESGAFKLGDVTVAPGETATATVQLPQLYSRSPVSMPVQIVNGRRQGPVLFVSGALHGDEINGLEIIRRVVAKLNPSRMRGCVVAVPVVNVFGFVNRSRYLPDRRDLNRSFPGSEKGSMAARLAHTFMQEIVMRCTHGIDLHTGAIGRENLPQIRAHLKDDPATADLARAFGAPVMLDARLRDGSLRAAVADHGISVLLYEGGEALRFDEVAIRAGERGVVRVMRHLGMLPPSRARRTNTEPLLAAGSFWLRAEQSGILRMALPLGSHVHAGQPIAWIADPLGEREVEVCAETDGVIIGRTTVPLVHEGDAIFHLADFEEAESAAESVEAFQAEIDPLADSDDNGEPAIV